MLRVIVGRGIPIVEGTLNFVRPVSLVLPVVNLASEANCGAAARVPLTRERPTEAATED